MFPRNNFKSILHELFTTHCTNDTLIMNPFPHVDVTSHYDNIMLYYAFKLHSITLMYTIILHYIMLI